MGAEDEPRRRLQIHVVHLTRHSKQIEEGGREAVTKPVILTVDDDEAVLSAIDRDLRQKYRADYRVMKAASGAEALEAAKELAARNRQVALFLVDQRMPGMSGTEMLSEVKQLHPKSRRVLLTPTPTLMSPLRGSTT
jgi:CheY-like chemotaxis protein